MDDLHTYQIELRGQVALDDIAPYGPPGLALELLRESDTLLTFTTDQSGLVGLIRQLHGLGMVLLAMNWKEKETEHENE